MKEELAKIEAELASYGDIVNKIEQLQKRKKKIENKIRKAHLKSLPVDERFAEWYGTGKVTFDWCPSEHWGFKYFSMLIDGRNSDYDRYRTYDLDYWDEDWSLVIDKEYRKEYLEDCEEDEKDEHEAHYQVVLKAAEEVMKQDLCGFVFDW